MQVKTNRTKRGAKWMDLSRGTEYEKNVLETEKEKLILSK
jgi:hypothetical protein